MGEFDKFFYIAHSPEKNLIEYVKDLENDSKFSIYFVDKISELAISSGLVEWIINKSS